MSHPTFLDELERLLNEVDELEARDKAGRNHAQVMTRLEFWHAQLRVFEQELAAFRQITRHSPAGAQIWAATLAELRATQPRDFISPARSLVAGDLDLLQLVAYTAASIARLQERRAAFQSVE